jgi:hypothetical protein
MDKFAQRRSILNKLREKVNIPGATLENFFKPELDRIMKDLRLTDDNIRTILMGQKVGDADVQFSPGRSAKELLKSAHSNFNRREYIKGVADLGEFHKRLHDCALFTDKLKMSVDKIHHNFLFQNLEDKDKSQIKNLRDYMSKKSQLEATLIKRAGSFSDVFDFFHNIKTQRGRALAAWEKKYPKVVADLRDGGNRVLQLADNALAGTLQLLKGMATARAIRSVDEYMGLASQLKNEYVKFDAGDKGFSGYYNKVILPYLQKQEEIEQDSQTSTPVSAPEVNISTPTKDPTSNEIKSPLTLEMPDLKSEEIKPITSNPSSNKVKSPLTLEMPTTSEAWFNTPEEIKPSKPVETVGPETGEVIRHAKFYASLKKLGGESPYILKSYITKYAKSIEHFDLATAIKLLNIVKNIRG